MIKTQKFNLSKSVWACVALAVSGGCVVPTASHAMETSGWMKVAKRDHDDAQQVPHTSQFKIPQPFFALSYDILEYCVSQLPRGERSALFTTCTAFNQFGLQIYYLNRFPELKDLNWYKLDFPTEYNKLRFNQLVLGALCVFDWLSSRGALNSCERRIYETPDDFEDLDWKNFLSLSQIIVTLAQGAQLDYEKKQPKGWLAAKTGIDIFEERDKQPLIPLFQWFTEYAKGEVIVKSHYSEMKHRIVKIRHLPAVKMSTNAENYLSKYAIEITGLLNQNNPQCSAEYGLHLMFGKWHALTNHTLFFTNEPYRIFDGNGMLFKIHYIEIPHIYGPVVTDHAHPVLYNLFHWKGNDDAYASSLEELLNRCDGVDWFKDRIIWSEMRDVQSNLPFFSKNS